MDVAKARQLQQAVKWTVYALLLINFAFYIVEDWNRAVHTLQADATIADWAREFATSIDESAWFLLLFMFELETYILEDEEWTGWVGHTVRGIRLLCYAMIAHTIYAFVVTVIGLQPTVPARDVSGLCDLADNDISYVYNLEYTKISSQNCEALSDRSEFYWLGGDPIVSDLAGLERERELALVDLAEAIVWLLILFAIEIVVRLQAKGITASPVITVSNRIQLLLYLLLIAFGVYWASLSHWLYLWDELVWILGFAAIEMNISVWREELIEEGKT